MQKRTQEGVPAITVNQQQKGMDVLRQRSVDLKVRSNAAHNVTNPLILGTGI
jgi:hypothetical protein